MTPALHTLLGAAVARQASDLHLSPEEHPWLRVQGAMEPLPLETGALSSRQIEVLLEPAMRETERERWRSGEVRSINFGYAAEGLGRFRVNVSTTMNGTAAVMRRIETEIPTVDGLGLPDAASGLADGRAGLILVTGAMGAGKSSTLAALVDRINRARSGHIVTLEDPIEFVHTSMRSRITQREVGVHTESYTAALADAVRQDANVLVVQEIRTVEQLELVLQAAETGQLVLGSLHTINAVNAISRMVGMVETARQGEVRAQIGAALRGVISQRLVPTLDGRRAAAFEVLISSPAVAANIEGGNTVEIRSALESRRDGMRTMEQSLAELVATERITYAAAADAANDVKALDRFLATAPSAYR
jgi:twitching motility protein PilT